MGRKTTKERLAAKLRARQGAADEASTSPDQLQARRGGILCTADGDVLGTALGSRELQSLCEMQSEMEEIKGRVQDETSFLQEQEMLVRRVERAKPMHELRKTLELPRGAAPGNGAILKLVGHRSCAHCGLEEEKTLKGKLASCARCVKREVFEPPLYCSTECQRAAATSEVSRMS